MEYREETTNGFLWGVATSGYQSEGGFNGKGEPQTNWARSEREGDVAVVGTATEFWTRYREDFETCRQLGLKAFRLSIEWSRVQPTHRDEPASPPPFDEVALDGYAQMFIECRRQGLEPVVTLHHFVHPAWLGSDPWLKPETAGLFADFVKRAVPHVNRKLVEAGERPIRYFITINEPNMLVLNTYMGRQFPSRGKRGFATAREVFCQLLRAHVLAYNAIHDAYEDAGWDAPMITLNNYCSDVYWWDKMLFDLLAMRERGISTEGAHDYIVGKASEFEQQFRKARIPLRKDVPYLFGTVFKWLSNFFGYRAFHVENYQHFDETLRASKRARVFDYIGLDYYDPFAAHAFRWPVLFDHEFKNRSFHSWIMASISSKWWDWRVLPQGLSFFCENYARDYDRPVLIAENGMALRQRKDGKLFRRRDKLTRSRFLEAHVREVAAMVRRGVPVFGYLHWSLFDNYEWGTYTPRFGLFSIDYPAGTDRLSESPTGDRPSETYARLVKEIGEPLPRERESQSK